MFNNRVIIPAINRAKIWVKIRAREMQGNRNNKLIIFLNKNLLNLIKNNNTNLNKNQKIKLCLNSRNKDNNFTNKRISKVSKVSLIATTCNIPNNIKFLNKIKIWLPKEFLHNLQKIIISYKSLTNLIRLL